MPFCPCVVFNPFFRCVPGSFFYLPIFVWIFSSTSSLSLFLMFLIQSVEYFSLIVVFILSFCSWFVSSFLVFSPESVFLCNLVFCFDSSGFYQMFITNSLAFHRCLLSVSLVPVCLWCQKYGSEWEEKSLPWRPFIWLKRVWSGQ